MKKILFTSLMVVFSIQGFTQTQKDFITSIQKKYLAIYPDSIFANSCELSNYDYHLFLNSLFAKDPALALKLRPDSSGWRFPQIPSGRAYNEPMVSVYFNHKKYEQYPVVNISKEDAIHYCNWLTELYNGTEGRKYKRVEFRLPTRKEWMIAAKGKNKNTGVRRIYPWDGLYVSDSKGHFRANYAPINEEIIRRNGRGELYVAGNPHYIGMMLQEDGAMYTSGCTQYPPNEYGLYNVAGNVSEYVLETDKALGGSFISPAYYLQFEVDESEFPDTDKGGAYIGFRPFMFVIEK